MAASGSVQVDGLRKLRRSFSAVDPALQKELRQRLKGVAEIAAGAMRAAVPTDLSPKRPGVAQHWRDKISAGASGSGAYVTWGRATVPYAPWIEFGGRIVQKKRKRVLERPFVAEGRYIFPTAKKQEPELRRATERALDAVIRRSGL